MAEVGLDHRGVAADLGGRAERDRAAGGEHGHGRAQAHDLGHLVADQEEGLAAVPVERGHDPGQALDQRRVDAAERLVEQDQLGVAISVRRNSSSFF